MSCANTENISTSILKKQIRSKGEEEMGKKYRELSEKNKYSLPREDYLTAIHYSLRYPIWIEELRTAADTTAAIRYDRDKVQTSNNSDPTYEAAVRMAELRDKINVIDEIIKNVSQGMDNWLRMGVCFGLTFEQLKAKDMPCERKKYYLMRRRYYYDLAQKI